MEAPWAATVTGWHRHRRRPGVPLPANTTNEGWGLLPGHQRGLPPGHQRGLFHGHGQLTRPAHRRTFGTYACRKIRPTNRPTLWHEDARYPVASPSDPPPLNAWPCPDGSRTNGL